MHTKSASLRAFTIPAPEMRDRISCHLTSVNFFRLGVQILVPLMRKAISTFKYKKILIYKIYMSFSRPVIIHKVKAHKL